MTQYNRDFPEEMGHSIGIVLRLSDSYMIISTNQSRHFTIVKFSVKLLFVCEVCCVEMPLSLNYWINAMKMFEMK